MPKIGVNLSEEGAKFYEDEFKKEAAESKDTIGNAIYVAMKDYVDRQERKRLGLVEIELFIGEKDALLGSIGEIIGFDGKLIAKGQREDGVNAQYGQALYRTKKQKLLLFEERISESGIVSSYKIFESIKDLKDIHLLEVISEALKHEKIDVRPLDI